MTDEALKPCPFCDEQCATLVIDQGDKWAHYEPSCLEVRTGYDLSDDAAWRAEAVAAWNTRAGDDRIEALEAALRDAPAALNAMAAQVEAEFRDHDKAAARHDLVVQTFRKKVRDALESKQ